ncbi:MAG: hypothetical protein PHI35_08375, partial [Victivallaceae bacterium]|nr:hypothetical protein [Victivallaceae bacterium]
GAVFSGNSAANLGGAVCNSGNMSVVSASFINNSAAVNCGGLYNWGGTMTVNDSLFLNNHGTTNGGGFFNRDNTVTLVNNTFSGNSAYNGGALYNFSIAANPLTKTIVSGGVISGNTAENFGGAFYNYKGAGEFYGVRIVGNTADSAGAILNNTGTQLTISGGIVSGNIAKKNGGNGGAIINGGTAVISDVAFEDNQALEYSVGGAIINNGTLTLNNVDFTGNSTYNGGALANNAATNVTVNGGTFSNNAARSLGGAIYINRGKLTISGAVIKDNTAVSNGAGILTAMDGTSIISDCEFNGNNGQLNGGGVFNRGTTTVSNAKFYNNTVIGDGGGFYNFNGTASLSDCVFSGNVAVWGGAIHNNGGTLTLSNITLETATDCICNTKNLLLAGNITGHDDVNLTVEGTGTLQYTAADISCGVEAILYNGATISATGTGCSVKGLNFVTDTTCSWLGGDNTIGYGYVKINDHQVGADGKLFDLDNAKKYVFTETGLQVTVSASDANDFVKVGSETDELARIATTDDETVTYAATVSGYTGNAFFATHGEALTSGGKVLVAINDATEATICGGANENETFAGNIELEITSGGSANFVYGGGKSVNTGATAVSVCSGGAVNNAYAGAYLMADATGLGSTELNLDGALTGSAFGGNRVASGATVTAGNATVNVLDGATVGGGSFVAGAGFVLGGGTLNVADVAVNWNGGVQAVATNGRGLVAGGIAGTDATLTVTTTTTDITSGSVYYIYGGVWAQNQATGNVGTANITITGGDHGVVYGGGIALGNNTSSTVGNVNITVSNDTKLYAINAGGLQSSQAATITGAAQVTLSDTVSVTRFVNGEGANCTVTLNNFTGSFGGISGFESVEVKGATSIAQEFQMAGSKTSSWAFDLTGNTAGELMTWNGNSTNSFDGDTIALTFDTTDAAKRWTLVSVNGSRGEDLLDLSGATITYNSGSTTDWELTQQEDGSGNWSLVLAYKA